MQVDIRALAPIIICIIGIYILSDIETSFSPILQKNSLHCSHHLLSSITLETILSFFYV